MKARSSRTKRSSPWWAECLRERTSWRSFVLGNFDVTDANAYASRFMTITCGVKADWAERIPAVVHVDKTARPQIIHRDDNPLYYDVLSRFKALSGLPVLVNTSFNVHEEPIVNAPDEAADALVGNRVDNIVTDDGVYGIKS